MAEEVKHSSYETVESKKDEPCDQVAAPPTSVKVDECDAVEASPDRAVVFDFVEKKEEENKSEEVVPEFEEKVQVCEPKEEVEEKKHEGLLEKLHRSNSSSSSEEEVEEGGEKIKRKKKKGLKEKIKETIAGDKKEEDIKCEDSTAVPIEKCEQVPIPAVEETEDNKGYLDKIKKPEEVVVDECATTPEAEGKEKKGFLDKIKEKLPGYHPKGTEEVKEKEKEGSC